MYSRLLTFVSDSFSCPRPSTLGAILSNSKSGKSLDISGVADTQGTSGYSSEKYH